MKLRNGFLLFLLVLALPLSTFAPAFAAYATDFQAGNIIDDALFIDSNSMTVSDIQSFLNQKVGTGTYGHIAGQCDTNGTTISEFGGGTRAQYGAAHGNPAPFTCLKDYYEVPKIDPGPGIPANNYGGAAIPTGAKSSAEIIWDAAQRYAISPKVLLVMIQKESAGPLVTDDWPFLSQYTYAMGAHCPDGPSGAQCDSNYAGFSMQINESARLLRYYTDNMQQSWWTYTKPYQTNQIMWNTRYASYIDSSGASVACGAGSVYVFNRATAALYTYTPYQPNQAALNNLYGSVPSGTGFDSRCAAYGNRNFFRIYTDWFGSTRYAFGKTPSAYTPYATSKCTISNYDPIYVGRLYNPDTQDYLYTPNQNEACNAVAVGYIWDGIVFKSALATDTQAIPVYRISNYRVHMFLTDKTSRDNYIANYGFHDEGIALYGYSTQLANTIPAYSLSNGYTTILTSAGAEGSYFVNRYSFTSSGIAFYTVGFNGAPTGVFRLSKAGTRFYTTDPSESSNLQTAGFTLEGKTGLDDFAPDLHNLPVYRLAGPKGHFYTTDRTERDSAIVNYGYYSEGAGWYAPDSTFPNSTPVFRDTNYFTGIRLYTSSVQERNDARSYYGFSDEGAGWYSYPNP